jgi:general secretion pathway protein K
MTSRPGFALVAALWLVVALTAAGLDIGLHSRAQRLAIANTLESTRARAAAEAGIEHVRARLSHALRQNDARLQLDAWAVLDDLLTDTTALREARYHIAIRDPSARVHLDRADEEQLRRLLRVLRVDFGEADRIAQAVTDWRDADDLRRPRGAERDDYLRDGSPLLPRNAPFGSVEELSFVRGMTPELFARVAPHLTQHGNGLVNLNRAPEPVLLSLPGFTPEAAAVVRRVTAGGGELRRMQELLDAVPPVARQAVQSNMDGLLRRVTFETREIEVVSEGWVDGSPVRALATAVISWGGSSVVAGWRRVES